MNKKKIATLLLVGTLLVGGGALGARAWFSAETKVSSNLKVTTGTLKVEAIEKPGTQATLGWELQNTDANLGDNQTEAVSIELDKDKIASYENVRPGDSFIKEVKIQNTGSLKERLNIKVNKEIQKKYENIVEFTMNEIKGNAESDLANDPNRVLIPGETITAKISVNILTSTPGHSINGVLDGTAPQNWQEQTIELSDVLGAADLITVTGEQVNQSPNPQQ